MRNYFYLLLTWMKEKQILSLIDWVQRSHREGLASMSVTSKIPVYDTWKIHEYLVSHGIKTKLADVFVKSYADLVRQGKSRIVNGTAQNLKNDLLASGYTEQEADKAVLLIERLLRVDVAA
jgi:hypothetical protein